MTYGVKIDGTDVKTTYGLILLADISIGTPELQETLVEVPGRDGVLNMSYAIDGKPHYKPRPITFSLFSRKNDIALQATRDAIASAYHGREVNLILPTESGWHFHGILQIGAVSGFNSGIIPCSMTADPYRLKNDLTTATKTIGTTETDITLTNSGISVIPEITNTVDCAISMGGTEWNISAGDHILPGLELSTGQNIVTVSAEETGSITFQWQEAKL